MRELQRHQVLIEVTTILFRLAPLGFIEVPRAPDSTFLFCSLIPFSWIGKQLGTPHSTFRIPSISTIVFFHVVEVDQERLMDATKPIGSEEFIKIL